MEDRTTLRISSGVNLLHYGVFTLRRCIRQGATAKDKGGVWQEGRRRASGFGNFDVFRAAGALALLLGRKPASDQATLKDPAWGLARVFDFPSRRKR